MPEGDTIRRAAGALRAALAGQEVTQFHSALPALAAAAERLRLVGRRVERIESHGKHLLAFFSGGPVLHTHLGMQGGWRIDPAGSRPPATQAQVAIATCRARACCYRAAVAELLPRGVSGHPVLSRLGPDLLAAAFDPAAARARLRSRGGVEIAGALLDQGAVAGIGNVHKSEVLFLCRVPPRARVRDLDDETLDALFGTARRLMSRNLGPGPRRTTSALAAERLFVYRRSGRPCRRCGTAVRRIVQGEQGERPRATYFCPVCQRLPDGNPR
jgi:endonuclease-8